MSWLSRFSRRSSSKIHPNWHNEPKKTVAILGCGWGGYALANSINRDMYKVKLVSPRNHFLFTPMLPQTTVGTLEFRCVTEPIRRLKEIDYHQAWCESVDTDKRTIGVRDIFDDAAYQIKYDALICAVGARANDFGIHGVQNHAFFLKQIKDAQRIRDKIQELFERATKPTLSRAEREKLLSFVIVGGGPTSIEFAAELYDWLMTDGQKMFPEMIDMVQVSLVEASGSILSAFGRDLADYTTRLFRSRRIHVLTDSMVVSIDENIVKLQDGYEIPYGLVVWATGNMPVQMVNKLSWPKTRQGRLVIDSFNRVPVSDFVYAIGDCAEYPEKPLAPTAQVANQQGAYLAKMLNKLLEYPPNEWDERLIEYDHSFAYSNRGMMAHVGGYKAAYNLPDNDEQPNHKRNISGFTGLKAWLFWRSVYLSQLRSPANQILVPMFWFKAWAFGRDFTRF